MIRWTWRVPTVTIFYILVGGSSVGNLVSLRLVINYNNSNLPARVAVQ